MRKHITIVGAFHIAYAMWEIMWAVVIFVVVFGLTSSLIGADRTTLSVLTSVGCLAPGMLIAVSVLGIIGGAGLLRLRSWARYLVLVLSIVDLLNIPFGTAIGIYSIWVLVNDETVKLFAGEHGQ
jgi:hypothetical protein